MGWIDGEYVEGVNCEDAPCCGCCGADAVERDAHYDIYDDAWFEN
jgi:Fe-S-cluster-containing hydrogenase component 2